MPSILRCLKNDIATVKLVHHTENSKRKHVNAEKYVFQRRWAAICPIYDSDICPIIVNNKGIKAGISQLSIV